MISSLIRRKLKETDVMQVCLASPVITLASHLHEIGAPQILYSSLIIQFLQEMEEYAILLITSYMSLLPILKFVNCTNTMISLSSFPLINDAQTIPRTSSHLIFNGQSDSDNS
jgi:hypothetical protein